MGRVLKASELKLKPMSISPEVREAARLLVEAKSARFRLREEAKDDIIELAVRMARRIVLKAIELDQGLLNDMYAEVVRSAQDLKMATLRVHPADREASKIDELAGSAGFAVESDPTLDRPGCIICAEGVEVDSTVATALELFKEAMKGTQIGGQ